jgi:general secretion pathway protein A
MYNEFYGFSEKPFELTPNPRFLYLTRSHREALASLTQGIKNRKGFISMTGEVGTGKTTLIYSLLNTLDEKVKTVFIFHTTVTFSDLLKTILRELDLAAAKENKGDLLHQLIQYVGLMGTKGETLAIIIDEAQNLPPKVMGELQMFSNLESKVIQIVFVGQPELEDKLNSGDLTQLKKSIEIRRQIRGLSEEESKEYIDHRLKLVGSRSSEIFTPNAISMICSYAQGIPRVINVLCDNALLMGYSLSKKRIDVDIIREVIKKMEGLSSQKTIPSSTSVFNKFHAFPFGLQFLLNKVYPIIIIFLLCLGAFILLTHRYLEQKSFKIWDIKSIKRYYIDTEPPSTETSSQITPPSTSIATTGREHKLKEVVAVKKGQTLSQLTQNYYGMINETLIDFILELNPEITNIHLIIVDQRIKIPNITEELFIIQSPDRTYKIHAGTFKTPDPVKFYRDEPVLKGKKIEILPRKVSPQETWYRVMIGMFDNKNEALKMISLLKKNGLLSAFGDFIKIE